MRVLAATVGALLISVSHIALAQEHRLGMRQHESHNGEAARAGRQCEPLPLSLTQAELRQGQPMPPEARQEEPKQQPAPTQAEMHHDQPMPPETSPAEARPEMPAQAEATEAEALLKSLPEARPAMSAQVRATEAETLLKSLPEVRQDQPMQAEGDGSRQPEAMKAEMQQDQPAVAEMPVEPKWTALKEQNLGTAMDLPRAVFSMADGHAHKGVGRKYKTPDGRAKVAIWTQRNTRRDTPETYLRRTFKIPRATKDYERFTPDFAAISGAFGSRVYYIRCNLSPQGAFHCFDLAYPVREKKAWDGIVTRMSRSLRPLSY